MSTITAKRQRIIWTINFLGSIWTPLILAIDLLLKY